MVKTTKILMFSANPTDTGGLRLTEDAQEIESKLRESKQHEAVQFITEPAISVKDVTQALHDHQPQLVYFSGHGSRSEEILLLDDARQPTLMSKADLADLFDSLRADVRVVVLNACYSKPQAEAILQEVGCVIGIAGTIKHRAAVTFATEFYKALGAGRSVLDAFHQGKAAFQLEGSPQDGTPELLVRADLNAAKIVVVTDPAELKGNRVQLDRLPRTSLEFEDREIEMAALDAAWADTHANVISIVGIGGIGKTALVNTWIRAMRRERWRGAVRVFAWSFYEQGGRSALDSSDEFIRTALEWLGDREPNAGSAQEKARRLAQLIGTSRMLLILDGVERLQEPSGHQSGHLLDPAIRMLLQELAESNVGLCVLSTRLPIRDLEDATSHAVRSVKLSGLPSVSSVSLLRRLGVRGDMASLALASARFGQHPLSLALLGRYLRNSHAGDIAAAQSVAILTIASNSEQFNEPAQRAFIQGLSESSGASPGAIAIRDIASGSVVVLIEFTDAAAFARFVNRRLSNDEWWRNFARDWGISDVRLSVEETPVVQQPLHDADLAGTWGDVVYVIFCRIDGITAMPTDQIGVAVEALEAAVEESIMGLDEVKSHSSVYGRFVVVPRQVTLALDTAVSCHQRAAAAGVALAIGVAYGRVERTQDLTHGNVAGVVINRAARLAHLPDGVGRIAVDQITCQEARHGSIRFPDTAFGVEQTGQVKRTTLAYYWLQFSSVQPATLTVKGRHEPETAHVIAYDIERYSEQHLRDMVRSVQELTSVVRRALDAAGGNRPEVNRDLWYAPAGDGGVVVFRAGRGGGSRAAWTFASTLARHADGRVPLRIGIATGPVVVHRGCLPVGRGILEADSLSGLPKGGAICASRRFLDEHLDGPELAGWHVESAGDAVTPASLLSLMTAAKAEVQESAAQPAAGRADSHEGAGPKAGIGIGVQTSGAAPVEALLVADVEVFVWQAESRCRRIGEPGALPVHTGTGVRVEARWNRPVIPYIVWINSNGVTQPLYPWVRGEWTDPPPPPPVRWLLLPLVEHAAAADRPPESAAAAADSGHDAVGERVWTIDTPAGLETLVVLARDADDGPLSADAAAQLRDILGGFPARASVSEPTRPFWFECRRRGGAAADQPRLSFATRVIADPVQSIQSRLRTRLGDWFTLIRSVTFANAGGGEAGVPSGTGP